MTRYFKAPVGSLAQRKMAEWEKKLKAEAKKIAKKVKSNPTVRIPARITADGRVFVTAGAMRRLNPHANPAYRIVPITKERYERHIRPLLRSPYNLQPFTIFKRTQGRGQSMLFHGDEFIKGGTKTFLKKYAKREAGL